MARALMRTGLGVAGAYELARRIEQDLAASGKRTADFDRIEELAVEVLGEPDGGLRSAGFGATRSWTSSTCR